MKKKIIKEFQADHDPAMLPEPMANPMAAHANRAADQQMGETEGPVFNPGSADNYMNLPRSAVAAMIVDKVLAMKGSELVQLVSRMFGPENQDDPSVNITPSAQAMNLGSIRSGDRMNATMEELTDVFGGETLSEDAQLKIKTLFESAVNLKVSLIEAELAEEYQEKLDEATSDTIELMVENINRYTTEIAKEFIQENKLSVIDTVRVSAAEQFMSSLRNLLKEANIAVNEDSSVSDNFDRVGVLENKIASMEQMTNDIIRENMTLRNSVASAQKTALIEQSSLGLNPLQRSQFFVLAESIEYKNPDEFKNQLKILKEQKVLPLTSKRGESPVKNSMLLNEDTGENGSTKSRQSIDPKVDALSRAISSGKIG